MLNFAKICFRSFKKCSCWMCKREPHAESTLHKPEAKLGAFLLSATFTKQYRVHIKRVKQFCTFATRGREL